ncbi:MAG: bZIP transcription factor [Cyanobacteria bacterium J06598_1]
MGSATGDAEAGNTPNNELQASEGTNPKITDSKPTDPKLAEQIKSQVASLENESLTIENSEVQARIRHLIKLIKTSLQSRDLNEKTQRELAKLLSLTPTLDGRHAQQLNLLDLAVSLLLEPNSSGRADGTKAELRSNAKSAKNLVFVQETRRQIAHQSRAYPDLFKAIFITGGGTPYIRLISGLSWFFLLFVMTPLAVAGITFAARDIAGFSAAQEKVETLQIAEKQLKADNTRLQTQVNALTRRRDALAAQLGRTNSQIAVIVPEASANGAESSTENISGAADSQAASSNDSTNPTGVLNRPESNPPNTSVSTDTISVELKALNEIRTEIETELSSNTNRVMEADESSEETDSGTIDNDLDEVVLPSTRGETAADRIFTTSFSLILLAVSMGALGSTISVIVRANTFIRQAQENDNDLFLTGFFRPFVGMSFAIFCVALVEAGIFSGIFDLTNRKDTDRTYFYVAIAFVAGFSERLVRDVVIKTEDTLAGPTGNSNRWS